MRTALVALAALLVLAAPAGAQGGALAIDGGPLEPGVALYTARDLGTAEAPMQVVDGLYRAGADGTTAVPMPTSECLPPCLAIAERVELAGGQLRPVPPDWPRLGWIVAVTKEGVRVEIGDTFVGRGNTMVGVLPGDYTVSFWLGPNNVITRQNRVPVANEVTVPNFSARRAGRVTAAQMPGAPPSGTALVAARSTSAVPIAGWRMVQIEDEAPEPPPTTEPIAAVPTQPIADEPDPPPTRTVPSGPPAQREEATPPPAEPEAPTEGPEAPAEEPEAAPEEPETPPASPPAAAPSDCASDAADLMDTLSALEREGRYAEAEACVTRVLRQDRDRADLRPRLDRLRDLTLSVNLLTAAERERLPGLRAEVAAAAEAGDPQRLLAASDRVLALVPGDLATMYRLEGGFSVTERPANGPPVTFTFVPGGASDPQRAAGHGEVPALGFLLTTAEVTNAQFAHFLNQQPPDSDRRFVAPNPRGIVKMRSTQLWEPGRAAADLPAVDATWEGAAAYAEWVGGRLPTAAEWTWAYEAGGALPDDRAANLAREGSGRPVLPGALPPDGLGLYHMAGNVWEWLARTPDLRDGVAPIGGGSYSTLRSVVGTQPVNQTNMTDPDGQVGIRVLRPLGN